MIFSTSTEYAIRGISELALRNAEAPVMLDELVAGTDLPRDFLAKIFQRLVRVGVLRSTKGRGGGFVLARPAEKIMLGQIVTAIEGPQLLDCCIIGLELCDDAAACAQHELYKPIRQRLKDYLNTTTVADLAASLRKKKDAQAAVAIGESPMPLRAASREESC